MRNINLRTIKNWLMTLLMLAATVAVLVPLVLIFFHIVKMGISSINLDFFLNIPKPTGETGGGMANGMLGSFVLIAIASAIGLPLGIFGAIYLSEYGGTRFSQVIRFSADVLNGIPSIITGMVAYTLIVVPMQGFSALAGAVLWRAAFLPPRRAAEILGFDLAIDALDLNCAPR